MAVYSSKVDPRTQADLQTLKRIRRGWRRTATPWLYQCILGDMDIFAGFPVHILEAKLVKVSAKIYKQSAIETLTVNYTEILEPDTVRIAVPLSEQGMYALRTTRGATPLRYGHVYALYDAESVILEVKRPSAKDYYLLMIDCAKT